MKKIFYLLLPSVLFFYGCEPSGTDEITEVNELLEINNLEVLEQGGAKFEATYTGPRNFEAGESGFYISLDRNPSLGNSQHIAGTALGNITSGELDTDLVFNVQYYIKAYARFSGNNIVYSETKNFVSLGSVAPEISEINRALIMDTVTIRGKYFSNNIRNLRVNFGTAASQIIYSNDSIIRSIVPANLENFNPQVSVTAFGKEATYREFSLLSPTIESVSPNTASLGDTVVLIGNNFDFDNSRNKIIIENEEVTILNSTRNTIQFVLPERVSVSTLNLKLHTQLQEATLPRAVTIKKPTITGLPTGSRAYEIIEVTGTNFSIFPEENKIYFNDLPAEVLEASRTKLKVRIPIGPYIDRQPKVRMELMDYTVRYEQNFNLSDVWLLKSRLNLGSGFRGSKHFIHNNLAYIFETEDENTRWKVYIMNPTTDTWSQIYVPYPRPDIKNKDFSIIYNKNSGRIFFYFSTETDNFYEFFLNTRTFSLKTNYPGVERGVPATFSIDNSLYIGLGRFMGWGNQDRALLSRFWSYNINNNTWNVVASFPHQEERSDLSIFVINGNAYLGNGSSDTGDIDFWKYSPASDQWIRLADFDGARTYTSFFEYGGKAYVYFGGFAGNPEDTAFEYNPATDKWRVLEPVNEFYYTYFIYPQASLALRFENSVYLGMTKYPFIEFFRVDLNRL